MSAALNTELNKIANEAERDWVRWAATTGGVGPNYAVYFVRLLRHKLGHRDKRDNIVPLPIPPAGLKPGEHAFITGKVDALVRTRVAPPPAPVIPITPRAPRLPATGVLPDSVARQPEDFDPVA